MRGNIWVAEVLKIGNRGVRAKIWTFLYVNESRWFTAKEISDYLEMPHSTVQVALKDLLRYAPRVWSVDKERELQNLRQVKDSFFHLFFKIDV